tara:strand:- start:37 stop:297 length:261 start_codon:yes stop_codon:yes gene_type:complete
MGKEYPARDQWRALCRLYADIHCARCGNYVYKKHAGIYKTYEHFCSKDCATDEYVVACRDLVLAKKENNELRQCLLQVLEVLAKNG